MKAGPIVAIFAFFSTALASQPYFNKQAFGSWAYGEEKDAVTDQVGASAGIMNADETATIGIKCDPSAEGNPITILLRTPREIVMNDRPLITIRVDGKPPLSNYWYRVTSDSALMYPGKDVRKWSSEIAQGSELLVRVIDVDSQPTDLHFTIGKPREVFKKVYATCGARSDHLDVGK